MAFVNLLMSFYGSWHCKIIQNLNDLLKVLLLLKYFSHGGSNGIVEDFGIYQNIMSLNM